MKPRRVGCHISVPSERRGRKQGRTRRGNPGIVAGTTAGSQRGGRAAPVLLLVRRPRPRPTRSATVNATKTFGIFLAGVGVLLMLCLVFMLMAYVGLWQRLLP